MEGGEGSPSSADPPVPLQGFRCAADPQPVLELDLRGCRVAYKAKRGKKMPHALKVTGTAGEMLVIGFQSRQQAEDWRKVWRCCSLAELCVGRKNGGQPCWGAPKVAGDVAICPQLLSHPGGAWSPVWWGSRSCSSPICLQVIEEVSSNAPSGLAAISVPASPSTRLSRVSQLSPPAQDTQVHGKGAAGGVKSPSQLPVLPSPLGDAGEGCTRLTVGLNDREGLFQPT